MAGQAMMGTALWILLAVSSGVGNVGTVTVIARFETERACEAVRARMPAPNVVSAYCVKAEGVRV